jgi:hypothetical protein
MHPHGSMRIRFLLGPELLRSPESTHPSLPLPALKPSQSAVTMHVCYESTQRLCKAAHSEKNFVNAMNCLKINAEHVSESCLKALSGTPSFECATDVHEHCHHAKSKEDLTRCLIRKKHELSHSCVESVKRTSTTTSTDSTSPASFTTQVVNISPRQHRNNIQAKKSHIDQQKKLKAAQKEKSRKHETHSQQTPPSPVALTPTTSFIQSTLNHPPTMWYMLLGFGIMLTVILYCICSKRCCKSNRKSVSHVADSILNDDVDETIFSHDYSNSNIPFQPLNPNL